MRNSTFQSLPVGTCFKAAEHGATVWVKIACNKEQRIWAYSGPVSTPPHTYLKVPNHQVMVVPDPRIAHEDEHEGEDAA